MIHYRCINMPTEPIPSGSTVNVEVIEVKVLDDGDIEIVMKYLEHYD